MAHELRGCHMNQRQVQRADFVTDVERGEALVFSVTEKVDKRFFSHTVVAEFGYRVGNSPPGQAEIHLRHTGSLTRIGIRGKVKHGDDWAASLLERVVSDATFVQTILPLDFKTFYLRQDEQGWQVTTTQIGASWIAMAFPPVRRYVPMGADQVKTLLATFQHLQSLLRS